MKYSPTRLNLIAIDGVDGSGKTTLTGQLLDILKSRHPHDQIVTTALLGAGPISQLVRTALVDEAIPPTKTTTAVWMASAILETYHHQILPALTAGKIVIVDRWISSYYAYQCCAETSAIAHSLYYNALIPEFIRPSLYIWCDTDSEIIEQRMLARSTLSRYDQQSKAFKRTVWAAYDEYYVQFTTAPPRDTFDRPTIAYRYDSETTDSIISNAATLTRALKRAGF